MPKALFERVQQGAVQKDVRPIFPAITQIPIHPNPSATRHLTGKVCVEPS